MVQQDGELPGDGDDGLGDVKLGIVVTALVAAGDQAQAGADFAARAEASRVFQGQVVAQRGEGPDPRDAAQEAGFGVVGVCDLMDLPVVGLDALGEGGDGIQDGSEGGQELLGDCRSGPGVEAAAEQEGSRAPVVLTRPRAWLMS
ncbi:MAG: hypothetical protein A2Z37_16890 [Chloroflexi bacterium RBG_19FT_COMBO_62_14]|nr:MAG: hypothetical protein A2Z37_16890 [Chloroflexi bacterium RBG_19FT_COMBO_62_14]